MKRLDKDDKMQADNWRLNFVELAGSVGASGGDSAAGQ
jgi:hypothetical protein